MDKLIIDAVNKFECKFPTDDDSEVLEYEESLILLCVKTHKRWIDGVMYDGITRFNTDVFKMVCNKFEYNEYIKKLSGCPVKLAEWLAKKDAKPLVYTQAMHEAELPPIVGMECLIFNGQLLNPIYEKSQVDFIGCHIIVYSSDSCTERTCNLELVKFKPIEARTDKEKAINEVVGMCGFDDNGSIMAKAALIIAYDKWVK